MIYPPTTREQWAWVAGLLEGEGCFSVCTTTKTQKHPGYQTMTVVVNSTDRDVVEQIHCWTGMGTVQQPRDPGDRGRKPIHRWRASRRDQVLTLVGAVWPFMGQRRRDQIGHMVQTWRSDSAAVRAKRQEAGCL